MDFKKLMQDMRERKELSCFLENHCIGEARKLFPDETARGLIKDNLLHNEIFNTNGFNQSLDDDVIWELLSSPEKLVKCWQSYNTAYWYNIRRYTRKNYRGYRAQTRKIIWI